jgi:predicted esterase
MNLATRSTFFALLGCLLLFSPLVRAESGSNPGPESLAVFRPETGSFLDVDLQVLGKQAYDAYQTGKYEESARAYLKLLQHDITNSNDIYNLACCYGLLKKDSLAAQYLDRAVRAGFDDLEHVRRDPDFDSVRSRPVFAATLDRLDSVARAKQADLGKTILTESPVFLKCRVHLPAHFDSTRSYPLVIGLHGYGDNLDHFIALWKRFGDSSLIFAAPQAPYPFSSGSPLGFSWFTGDDSATGVRATGLTEDYVAGVARELTRRYKTNRTYLLGFSQGCALTYQAGIRNHGLFDGLICFGGWLDTTELRPAMLDAAKKLRVFIGHGKQDRMVEYRAGEMARDILKQHGYDVTFESFDGGHTVDANTLKKFAPWLKK